MLNSIDALALEGIRDLLAREGNLKKFLQTYSPQQPQIPNLNTGRKWDKQNFEYVNLKVDHPMAFYRTKVAVNWLANLMGRQKSRVLDLGFGPANFEQELMTRGIVCDLVGLDISPRSVRLARKKYPQWKFEVSELSDLRLKSGEFDFVVMMEVLEHIPPTQTFKTLKKIWKTLKPKGWLILSVPINEDLEGMLAQGLNPNAHVRKYTPNILSYELSSLGFRIIKNKSLYAFGNHFLLKSFLADLFKGIRQPNNLILLCQKL